MFSLETDEMAGAPGKAAVDSSVKRSEETFTRNDLAIDLSHRVGCSVERSKNLVEHVIDSIRAALLADKKVEFRDFGTLKIVQRKAKIGRNPKDPAAGTYAIPPRAVVKFRAGKDLDAAINNETPDKRMNLVRATTDKYHEPEPGRGSGAEDPIPTGVKIAPRGCGTNPNASSTRTSVTIVTSVPVVPEKGFSPEENEAFPTSALPAVAAQMVKEIALVARTPEPLAGVCVLAALSAALGKGIAVESGPGRTTWGNLYLIGSALSGTGKTETFRPIMEPLFQAEREYIDQWKRKTVEEERRGRTKGKTGSAKMGQSDLPQWVCEDVTVEKLAAILHANGEMVASISSDAGAVINNLLGRFGRRNRTEDSLYVRAYSGDPCRVDRLNRAPIQLHTPCLTFLWLVQPGKLEVLYGERQLLDGGFLARVMPVHTETRPQKIDCRYLSVSGVDRKNWYDLLKDLSEQVRRSPKTILIQPTQEAGELMTEHHDRIVDRRCSDLADIDMFAARWNEWAWRLCVVLHCGKHGGSAGRVALDLETARSAIIVADWFACQQLAIFERSRRKRRTEVENQVYKLLATQPTGVTGREIQRARIADSAHEAVALLIRMENEAKLKSIERFPPGGGHSVRVYTKHD